MEKFQSSNGEANLVSVKALRDNLAVKIFQTESNKDRLNGKQEAMSRSDLDMSATGPLQSEADKRNPLRALLSTVAADVLQTEPHELDQSRSFLALGGDSLSAIDFMARCNHLDVRVDIADILNANTVLELIDGIVAKQVDNSNVEVDDHDSKRQPDQDASTSTANDSGQSVSMPAMRVTVLEIIRSVETSSIWSALVALLGRYSLLRTCLSLDPDGNWQHGSVLEPDAAFVFSELFVAALDDLQPAVQTLVESLDPFQGPVFGAILSQEAGGHQRLVFVAPSAMIGTTSSRILAHELDKYLDGELVQSHQNGFNGMLPSKHGNQSTYLSKLPRDLPIAVPSSHVSMSRKVLREASLVLDEDTTMKLLGDDYHSSLRTNVADVICAAVIICANEMDWHRGESVIMRTSCSKRLPIPELSQEVGCFEGSSYFEYKAIEGENEIEVLRRVKDLARRDFIEQRAQEQSQLSISIDCADLDQAGDERTVALRLLGSYILHGSRWSSHLTTSPPHLQVSVNISNGQLQILFQATKVQDTIAEVKAFSQAFHRRILHILSKLQRLPTMATLSDFSVIDMPYSALDKVFSELQARSTMPLETVQCMSPCSPMQETFLISQNLDPEAYQCRFVVKITSNKHSALFTSEKLAASWAKVVARHPSLRTSFLESAHRPGKFDQVIWKSISPQTICYQDSSAIFETGSVHRSGYLQVPHSLVLAQVSANEIYLRLDISHALVDGQSTEVFLADFCKAYRAETPLGDVIAYTDFVKFQRRLPTNEATTYWSGYLNGASESFLPVKASQGELSGLRAIQERLSFRTGLLDEFCGQHNVTVANICQVAWGLVLRSFTNSDKTCFSYVTSGRQSQLRGIQDAVGLFASTLICRLDFGASMKVKDVLKVTHTDFARSIPHQHAVFTGSKDARHRSPRQWGNSILSFHRPLPTRGYAQSGLEFQLITRSTPTDVSRACDRVKAMFANNQPSTTCPSTSTYRVTASN